MDKYGLDAVCEALGERKTLTAIAEEAGVSMGSLLTWIAADPERDARVRETRQAMARIWDEQAEQGIREAKDPFELSRAKELAHHFRWRASKIAAREYGDRVQHANDPDNPMPAPQFILQPVQPGPARQEAEP
jgi:hypothetical protein